MAYGEMVIVRYSDPTNRGIVSCYDVIGDVQVVGAAASLKTT